MRILVTNDDGVQAPGIVALVEALRDLGEVVVIAPDRQQSGAGHSLTLHRPLRVDKVDENWFSVDGTPTDCVNLAMKGFLKDPPEFVVSGINYGANMGDDVTYSGTVAAALEGTLLSVPSLAMSLATHKAKADFSAATRVAHDLARRVIRHGLPPEVLLNINIPDLPFEAIKEPVLTIQGKTRYTDVVLEKRDPRGRRYYWIGDGMLNHEKIPGSDFDAVDEGHVSVTPLHFNMTHEASLATLHTLLADD